MSIQYLRPLFCRADLPPLPLLPPSTPLLKSNPSVDLHVSVKGQLNPVSYCSPTMLCTHVYCASGSDKLTCWTVLGVQGALLSHFLHPVYITSIVLGDYRIRWAVVVSRGLYNVAMTCVFSLLSLSDFSVFS